MSSISEQLKRVQAIKERLLNLDRSIATAGADLCADIADRVINTGNDSTGGKFTSYSTNEVPAYLYFGRSLNSGGEAKVRAAAKKKEGVSYKQFRDFNGRPTNFKNFSFSQEMWRGFGVVSVASSGGIYTLEIGGKTDVSKDRIAYNSARETTPIIRASKVEIERLTRRLEKFVTNG